MCAPLVYGRVVIATTNAVRQARDGCALPFPLYIDNQIVTPTPQLIKKFADFAILGRLIQVLAPPSIGTRENGFDPEMPSVNLSERLINDPIKMYPRNRFCSIREGG